MNNGNEELVSDNINILLNDIARENGFTSYKIQITRGSNKGDGIAGIMRKVCITGEDQAKQNKTLHLIAKIAPVSEIIRAQMQIKDTFEREIYLYDKVFVTLQSFATERGLPSATDFVPKFYKGSTTLKDEALVLEDLRENGYVLHSQRCGMDEKHTALVFATYARMHALSLVIRNQEVEKLQNLVAPMDEDIIINIFKNAMLESIVHCATDAIKSLDGVDGKVIETYKKYVSEIPTILVKIRNDVDEYSVILHADSWANNMMFKYKDPENLTEPCEVRLLDFQAAKLGSPALDLCYFCYVSCSKNVLDDLNYYIQLYYQNLSSYVLKLGGDPERLLPYKVLEEHWRKYAKFGLLVATVGIKGLLSEENEKVDMGDVVKSDGSVSGAFTYEISGMNEYNDRVRHLIMHFYDNQLF